VLVTGAKVAVLLAFIGGALSYTGPTASVTDFAMSFQIEPVNIVSIAALAFITFFGFPAIAASAGEIIEPRKTVPKAIAASILTVTILYTLVIVAMVNTPDTIAGMPRQAVLQSGETAMGMVAAAFLGNLGQALIVAGAVFSMVSASNASVLAASGIGSLMGRRGQAPRRFSRIHPEFGTPYWSVVTVTGTIVALIVAFIAVFPAEGGALAGIHLGLENLTGFATLNLLLPLSAVNLALVYSRRRYPEMDRPLTVPLVPLIPALGIVATSHSSAICRRWEPRWASRSSPPWSGPTSPGGAPPGSRTSSERSSSRRWVTAARRATACWCRSRARSGPPATLVSRTAWPASTTALRRYRSST
jgi:amino acid transporter